jgi:histidinol-phosphatase (PHP family)
VSDYHLHLHPHADEAGGPPPGEYPPGLVESYVDAAAVHGVSELGFTEHLYRCREAAPVLGRFWEGETNRDLAAQTERMVAADLTLSLDAYVGAILAAKERGLPVKLGLEVDFFPSTIEAVLEMLAPYPFDFLIGSIHWVGGWSIDSGSVAYEFERRGVRRAWADYFELATALAASGTVDVLAHIDVCKKYGFRPHPEPVDLYEQVSIAAARSGTAVEVSSQGLRRPVGEIYPSPIFLKMFHAAGVPITLASDAHYSDQAAHGHAEVVAAARAAGYTEHLRFDRRRSYKVPLA